MDYKINVAVDAMGGDNAPEAVVLGVLDVIQNRKDIHVDLVGDEAVLMPMLEQYEYSAGQLEVVHASEVIETAEPPVAAVRKKKDSSMVVGMRRVRDGKADAFVSAGSSGAVLVGGQLIVGRLPGIDRPPLAPIMPTESGVTLLIDCGANVDAKPSNLVQFAQMGSIYMEHVVGIDQPKVGIVNIGAEEEKGNHLVKETFPLLKACKDINFIGSVEARDIPAGGCDVVVCEAFVGNVILKMYEGVSKSLMHVIKKALTANLISTIGAALSKKSLKKAIKTFDASEYGGAPLLGLRGLVVKVHGNATPSEIRNAILQCLTFKEQHINEMIEACLKTASVKEETHAKNRIRKPQEITKTAEKVPEISHRIADHAAKKAAQTVENTEKAIEAKQEDFRPESGLSPLDLQIQKSKESDDDLFILEEE